MRRIAIVTGASSGIGRETALELSRRDWLVACVGRDPSRTRAVAQETGGEAFIADFDRLDDVRDLARQLTDRFDAIHAVVNNAGGLSARPALSADGYELSLQRNVLGGVLLTESLLPVLTSSRARIVHTSSLMHRLARLDLNDLDYRRRRYGGGWLPYASAKLGVILYARSLAERTGLESYPVHPGYVRTSFGQDAPAIRATLALTRRFQISPQAGAAPLVHVTDTPELGVDNGTYFDGLTPALPKHPAATDQTLIQAYFDEVARRVGLKEPSFAR